MPALPTRLVGRMAGIILGCREEAEGRDFQKLHPGAGKQMLIVKSFKIQVFSAQPPPLPKEMLLICEV